MVQIMMKYILAKRITEQDRIEVKERLLETTHSIGITNYRNTSPEQGL